MSWRLFLPLVAAALLLGRPVQAPRLAEPLPLREYRFCDYPGALDRYLLAYAYAREQPSLAHRLLDGVERELGRCEGEHGILSGRVARLKASLP